jgi:hypothetical protein
LVELGINDGHYKHYDPLTIEGKTANSYVFNLADGGRHHKFKNLGQLRELILKETIESIKERIQDEIDK